MIGGVACATCFASSHRMPGNRNILFLTIGVLIVAAGAPS